MVSDEQTTKELLPMAYSNSTGNLKEMLLQFMSEDDPMLSILKWLCEQLMEAEVTSKVNAAKSERNLDRSGYRSGYRVRRFDTRMGPYICLFLNCGKAAIYPSLSLRRNSQKWP